MDRFKKRRLQRANEREMPKQTGHLNKTPQILRGELPPPEKILDLARECGFAKRLRKLHPVLLLYTLVFSLSAHKHPMVGEVHRNYKSMEDRCICPLKIDHTISFKFDHDLKKSLRFQYKNHRMVYLRR
jgi:uncharacterized protein YihD (DUF1040 family)